MLGYVDYSVDYMYNLVGTGFLDMNNKSSSKTLTLPGTETSYTTSASFGGKTSQEDFNVNGNTWSKFDAWICGYKVTFNGEDLYYYFDSSGLVNTRGSRFVAPDSIGSLKLIEDWVYLGDEYIVYISPIWDFEIRFNVNVDNSLYATVWAGQSSSYSKAGLDITFEYGDDDDYTNVSTKIKCFVDSNTGSVPISCTITGSCSLTGTIEFIKNWDNTSLDLQDANYFKNQPMVLYINNIKADIYLNFTYRSFLQTMSITYSPDDNTKNCGCAELKADYKKASSQSESHSNVPLNRKIMAGGVTRESKFPSSYWSVQYKSTLLIPAEQKNPTVGFYFIHTKHDLEEVGTVQFRDGDNDCQKIIETTWECVCCNCTQIGDDIVIDHKAHYDAQIGDYYAVFVDKYTAFYDDFYIGGTRYDCTEYHQYDYVCDTCGTALLDFREAHSHTKWTNTSTCTLAGKQTCGLCGFEKDANILGHTGAWSKTQALQWIYNHSYGSLTSSNQRYSYYDIYTEDPQGGSGIYLFGNYSVDKNKVTALDGGVPGLTLLDITSKTPDDTVDSIRTELRTTAEAVSCVKGGYYWCSRCFQKIEVDKMGNHKFTTRNYLGDRGDLTDSDYDKYHGTYYYKCDYCGIHNSKSGEIADKDLTGDSLTLISKYNSPIIIERAAIQVHSFESKDVDEIYWSSFELPCDSQIYVTYRAYSSETGYTSYVLGNSNSTYSKGTTFDFTDFFCTVGNNNSFPFYGGNICYVRVCGVLKTCAFCNLSKWSKNENGWEGVYAYQHSYYQGYNTTTTVYLNPIWYGYNGGTYITNGTFRYCPICFRGPTDSNPNICYVENSEPTGWFIVKTRAKYWWVSRTWTLSFTYTYHYFNGIAADGTILTYDSKKLT